MNNEAQARCEARKDRAQCRSSLPDDLQEPRRQDETRRTVDLGRSLDGPIMDRPRRDSRQQNGITARRLSQRLLQQNRRKADETPRSAKCQGVNRVFRRALGPDRCD